MSATVWRYVTTIDRLPNEILLMILELLPACDLVCGAGLVCKRWALLVSQRSSRAHNKRALRRLPKSIRALIVAGGHSRIIPNVLSTATRLRLLRELCCHAGIRFSNEDVAALGSLVHLQHLDVFTACAARDVSDSKIANHVLSLVVNSFTARFPGAERCQLRSLHMYGESLFTPPTRLLKLLQVRRDHLTQLTLRCADIRTIIYEAIGDCWKLTTLQLYSCWLMTAEDFIRVTRPSGLRQLHITGTVMVRKTRINDVLSRLPTGIEELTLSGSAFGDEHIDALADRLPNLRTLEAWRCQLTPYGVLRLASVMLQLEVLDLDLSLNNEYVGALRRHPKLEFIRCLSERPVVERDITRPYCLRRRPVPRVARCHCCDGSPERENIELPEGLRRVKRQVRVECAAAQYSDNTFRWRGEGFRAKIFYHWTSAKLLRPSRNPQLDPPFASTAYFNGI